MKTHASGTARFDGRRSHPRVVRLLAGLLCLPCFSGLEASNSAILEIGNRKQLFLDPHVVESLTHAKRVLNPAAKHNHGSGRPQVRVELLGVSHEPIEGFLLQESDPVGTTGRHVMGWQGRNDVSRLAGQTVRLRFSMKNSKLYSFQFR